MTNARFINLYFFILYGLLAYLCYTAFWAEVKGPDAFPPVVMGAGLLGITFAIGSLLQLIAAIFEWENSD
jgi:hypothetical protein